MAKFLTPDALVNVTVGDRVLQIKEKIIPDSARAPKYVADWCREGDPMKPLKKLGNNGLALGVTVHNTNDIVTSPLTDPAEQYTRATWPNGNMSGAVVHFYVYKDQIWQNLSLEEQGWHAGDGSAQRTDKAGTGRVGGNRDTLAIECIGSDPQSTDTTAALAAWLLKKIGRTVENGLYTHQFFKPSKRCPAYLLNDWAGFEARVRAYLKAAQPKPQAPAPKPESAPSAFFPPCPYPGRSIVDGLKSVGAPSSFAYRKGLATVNGVADYKGLAAQNTRLLTLLKAGKLRRVPEGK